MYAGGKESRTIEVFFESSLVNKVERCPYCCGMGSDLKSSQGLGSADKVAEKLGL